MGATVNFSVIRHESEIFNRDKKLRSRLFPKIKMRLRLRLTLNKKFSITITIR